jgi:catechol 2,3-dioxygenase-like lactoylglutathione lyase family enzyme
MTGIPLGTAIIGCDRLERSVAFYRDVIGLAASPESEWAGPAFERHWNLPRGANARAVRLKGSDDVGQVLLLEFDSPQRRPVRQESTRTWFGLYNLNFYTTDIFASVRELAALGFESWTDPVHHEISASAGSPTEVFVEGPDGVLINLVQLPKEPGTSAGDLAALVDPLRTATGYTAVCTSAHRVKDLDAAMGFHRGVLGLDVLIDATLSRPETNRLLGLPAHANTHSVFLWSGHPFGKVVLSTPLNYDQRDLVPDAVAPNIGYLAMSFELPDLSAALEAAPIYSEPSEVQIPALGARLAAMVRIPGSGALAQLVERR